MILVTLVGSPDSLSIIAVSLVGILILAHQCLETWRRRNR